jgi:hypothetical protein
MSIDPLKNRAYWNELLPQFHIEDVAFVRSMPPFNVDDNFKKYLSHQMLVEGYVQLDIPLPSWGVPIPGMGEGIAKLVKHDLMPVFAFVYDEFWLAFFRLHHVISNILGPFAILPDFWAWHVDPKKSESGWNPHRDKGRNSLFPDGKPKSMTIWITITQATPLNGCMYIVPADRDPTYNTPDEKKLIFKPNDIRALPGEAGTVFCWNQAVHHWGGHASPRAQAPRISMAMEFQRTDVPAFRTPLLNAAQLPSFDSRLLLISRQILQYQHMYPMSAAVKELATALGRG